MLRMQRRKPSRSTGFGTRKSGGLPRSAEPLVIEPGETHSGDIDVEGTIKIQGHVSGSVHATRIVVGTDASVSGPLQARTIHVDGTVNGRVSGCRISLGPTARIKGDVLYDTLSISNGASISGHCQDRATKNVAYLHDPHQDGEAVLPFNVARARCRKSVGHFLLHTPTAGTDPTPSKSMREIWASYQAASTRT